MAGMIKFMPRRLWRTAALFLWVGLWLTGPIACVAIQPSTPGLPESVTPAVAPTATVKPAVAVKIQQDGVLMSGDPVQINVVGSTVDDLRLALDGVDTGWRTPVQLGGKPLSYTWIAGEPGTYTIIGQARNAAGVVGETRREVVVTPYTAPDMTDEARLIETSVALPTYPMEAFQTPQRDPVFNWPYLAFDRDAFWASEPVPVMRSYRLIYLENSYLRVSILPELGGRVWQVLHKPTGDTMFYQNTVVKPSPWGPAEQLGWLALGGLEWALPVNEHGYDWGTAWDVETFEDDGTVGVRLATPDDGRYLAATVEVSLAPNTAFVTIATALENLTTTALDFHYWQTAMLAPGASNAPNASLRFVVPSRVMTVHSTGDNALPGPGRNFTWPSYFGRDLSRLGNWDQYLGFFEYPAAHGPFVGVYDPALDAGAVRVFPAKIAQGSKVFGLGWRRPIGSEHFTDDGSFYVELHGGLASTFFEPYTLAAGARVAWDEQWYPIHGIGDLSYANAAAALKLTPQADGYALGIYPTTPLQGRVVVQAGSAQLADLPFSARPDMPFTTTVERPPANLAAMQQPLVVTILDETGEEKLLYSASSY